MAKYSNIVNIGKRSLKFGKEKILGEKSLSSISKRDIAILVCMLVIALALLLNLSLLLYVVIRDNGFKAYGDLYTENCDQMKTVDTLVHLAINILSSMVVAATNYCSQLLAAPTQAEVIRAHGKGDWLETGVPSFHNLLHGRISGKRRLIWSVMMISSVPLHLFWNCVIFSAIPVTKYQVALATADFRLDPQPWNNTWITNGVFWSTYDEAVGRADHTSALRSMLLENRLEHLDRQACIERYIDTDIRHKDVVVVTSNISMSQGLSLVPGNKNSSLIYMMATFSIRSKWMWTSAWMCSSWHSNTISTGMGQPWCSREFLLPHADDWLLKSWQQDSSGTVIREVLFDVDYCLSAGVEQVHAGCAIRYSSVLIFVVTLMNAVKLACLWLVWKIHKRSKKDGREYQSLVTLGDAIENFLRHEDESTKELTFLERVDCTGKSFPVPETPQTKDAAINLRISRLRYPIRWFRATALSLWAATIFSYLIVVGALTFILVLALRALAGYNQPVDFKSLWQMGLGHVQAYAISLTEAWGNLGDGAFYATAFMANGCQLILSFGWFFANSLLTRMLLARQWSQFITQRKKLRVSVPTEDQRSSYVLSLPFRYSVPLLVASAMAHWLISQSLFVVQTLGFTYKPTQSTDDGFVRIEDLDGSVLGYSAIGMIFTMLALGVLLIGLLAISMRKLPYRKSSDAGVDEVIRMPTAAACSAAISSACHPSADEEDAYLLPLQWGKNEVGVWSLTSGEPLDYSLRG
ncbi:hypothetical protein F4781DRAFT_434395 [Annulohypoxylon bovei var. microspora]|nr:hypothetical protein F4781DRAFT_434395 [Annulohypoxylon bovei var. microspora]